MGKYGTGKVLRKCSFCQKEFYGRRDRLGKYCSKSCTSKDNTKPITRIKLNCLSCVKEFEIKKYRKSISKYCSIDCMATEKGKRIRGKNHPNWKGGISQRPFKIRYLIRKMTKEFGKCNECDAVNDLQGHHIMPYSERPDLGACRENIRILCKSCHANAHQDLKYFILGKPKNGKELDKISDIKAGRVEKIAWC